MGPRGRRTVSVVAAALLVAGVAVVLPVEAPRAAAVAPSDPLAFAGERIDEDDWQARSDDYLAWVAAKPLSPGNALSIMAHAEHARRTGGTWDSSAPSVADFSSTFTALDEFRDTNDFAPAREPLTSSFAGHLRGRG